MNIDNSNQTFFLSFLQREKIFPSRPITCKERSLEVQESKEEVKQGGRCRTCFGIPHSKNKIMPDKRTPFELPPKTWNYKITTNQIEFLRGGRHCYTYSL